MTARQPYFIASTTKLYVTAVILKLREENKLSLEDKIAKYLSPEIIHNLHVYKGKDYSNEITIKQLLSHTSGLPDYFSDKSKNGKSVFDDLSLGFDYYWSSDQAIEMSKKMSPKFVPETKGKAHYSDTNFQLLGKIIEQINGKKIGEVFDEMIFRPLGLKNTYLYSDINDTNPACLYFRNKPLFIQKAMTSFGADGGIVSTSEESMVFLKAFFNGQFFPKKDLNELYHWNKVIFPLEYGIGVMKFELPKILSPFNSIPAFIGHSGLSGAFTFYVPNKDVFLTGTVNQIHNPSISYKLLIKIVNSIK